MFSLVKTDPYLVVDTSLYPPEFQAALLTRLSVDLPDGLDAATDGLLIHSDNFQALNLLQARYREQVKCIYIDPPYNSPSSEILYKNSFKHSSWLSLMENRIICAARLMKSDGSLICAIDENEHVRLNLLFRQIFSSDYYEHNTIVVRHNTKGIQGGYLSINNEFALVISKFGSKSEGKNIPEENREWSNFRNWGGESERNTAKNCFYPIIIKNMEIVGFGDVLPDNIHPNHNEILDDNLIAIYPIDGNGIERKWTYARQSVENISHLLKVEKLKNGNYEIKKTRDKERYKTVWDDSKYIAGDYGSKILNNIIGSKKFDFPKSLYTVLDSILLSSKKYDTILDYFAGSGTTAHAVINLNREDDGKRKYILVEQAEYFNTVLKPRVQKVIYSKEWKDGKPQADSDGNFHGVSQIVKVLKLESYEDTLNNLQLKKPDLLARTLNDQSAQDYLLHYMLDIESRDSLLSSDDFRKPFDYRLNIASDSAGAYTPQVIDLVETFNYLLGLRVDAVEDRRFDKGYVFVEGHLDGERILLVWRDCERWHDDSLPQLLEKKRINPQDSEFAEIYINGDHTLPTVWQDNDADGGSARTLKIRSIEAEFLRLMFAEAE
ncbi:site-specific DNA-methyltransferase [Cardiobacterium hominis]